MEQLKHMAVMMGDYNKNISTRKRQVHILCQFIFDTMLHH